MMMLKHPKMCERTAKIVWRDFLFLILGAISLAIVGYVETNSVAKGNRIVDAGFLLTEPLHEWLKRNPFWVNFFAAVNSVSLVVPTLYVTYTTVWVGDYSLPFRVVAIQLLRSLCGFFTFLPPDSTYLTSYYDFPDILHCLVKDCAGAPSVMPFVSFFSGHVATMVIAGNHMWLHGSKRLAVFVHTLNIFQMVRLLATRGHYSIDLIIGWYMAVNVSTSAGRLGRHYSRGSPIHEIMPTTVKEAFETVTGVSDARKDVAMSTLLTRKEVQELLLEVDGQELVRTETCATLFHDHVHRNHILRKQQ